MAPPVSTTRRNAPGQGRKPADYVHPQERLDYEAARARNEAAKADLNEHELAVKRGQFVERAAVEQATATALAALSQALRSVPDNLERKLGTEPEVAREVGLAIDAALDEAANAFESMFNEAAQAEDESEDELW